jgi:hypothetical protein
MGLIWVAAFAFDLAYYPCLTGIAAAWTAQVTICKRAGILAAETNGEVGTRYAHPVSEIEGRGPLRERA